MPHSISILQRFFTHSSAGVSFEGVTDVFDISSLSRSGSNLGASTSLWMLSGAVSIVCTKQRPRLLKPFSTSFIHVFFRTARWTRSGPLLDIGSTRLQCLVEARPSQGENSESSFNSNLKRIVRTIEFLKSADHSATHIEVIFSRSDFLLNSDNWLWPEIWCTNRYGYPMWDQAIDVLFGSPRNPC